MSANRLRTTTRLPAALSLFIVCGSAAAAISDAVAACRGIADAARRLACYDAIDLNARTTEAPPRSGAVPARPPGGAEAGAPAGDVPVRSTVVGPFDGWSPNRLIQLENGQVWRIADGSSGIVTPAAKLAVTVRPGLFGAFYIEFEGSNRTARVVRVR